MSSQKFVPNEDESVSQELKELIPTLPKEKEFISYLVQYQGVWYPFEFLHGVISVQKHFQVKDSDVFIATMPKSGTTWLKSIIFALMNRKRYDPCMKNHPLLTNNSHELVPCLETQVYGRVDKILDLSSFDSPRVLHTHMPYGSLPASMQNSKLVYLCRNPRDTLVSHWHFTNRVRTEETVKDSIKDDFEMFCKGVSLFGPFWDHVLEYWNQSKKNPGRIFFLTFEDMKEQPGIHLRRLAEFLDFPVTADEEESGVVDEILKLCSFDNLTSLEVNKTGKMAEFGVEFNIFFRQGKVGDWENYLDAEMVEKMDKITDEKFSGSGLVL